MYSVLQRRSLLALLVLAIGVTNLPAGARADETPQKTAAQCPFPSRFPSLSNEETWSRMPQDNPPLPVWARILTKSLPRSTTAMLRLDYVHRAKNPLNPLLRGKLRWVVADANRCEYGKRYAEADLKRAGLPQADLDALGSDLTCFPPAERAALAFARKLTLAAHTVTDDEVSTLLKDYGPEQVVAMVHTLAFANFQDRICLALGVAVEPDGPYPPVNVLFNSRMKSAVDAPERPPWKSALSSVVEADGKSSKPQWDDRDFADVQKLLADQKSRTTRIPLPDWDKVAERLPEEIRKEGPSDIVWSNVSMGYQPELTGAWFDGMRAFKQEGNLDRIFSNSMFWVITRSNQCFY